MSDSLGLIQSIFAKPYDDEPRLIYADWLEDRGEVERAELIRLQCEFAAKEYWEHDYERLKKQNLKLLANYEPRWKAQFGVTGKTYFYRGLVEQLTVTPKSLSKLDPAIFSQTPIMSVQFSRMNEKNFESVLNNPILKSIPGLKIVESTSTEHTIRLFGKFSTKLQKLDMSACSISFYNQEFVQALAQSRFLKHLTSFCIRACQVPDTFFRALADHGGLPKVQRFEFGGGFAITHPAHFSDLKMTKLRFLKAGGKFRVVDCKELCNLPLKKLNAINLAGSRPPAAGLKLLIEAGLFKKAARINLSRCNLSKASLEVLANSKAPNCIQLNLAANENLNNLALTSILSGKTFPNLKAVNTEGTKVVLSEKLKSIRDIVIVT